MRKYSINTLIRWSEIKLSKVRPYWNKHYITLIMIILTFAVNYLRTEHVHDILRRDYNEQLMLLNEKLEACTSQQEQFKAAQKKIRNQELELDAWRLAAVMYLVDNPKDTLFRDAVSKMMQSVHDDSLYTNGRDGSKYK